MKTRFKNLVFAMAFMLIATGLIWQPPVEADTAALGQAFDTLHWIAYSPLNYNPNINKQPTRESIRTDLEVLKRNGFGGVVTYGCNGAQATIFPEEASKLGFKIVIGVWDPNSATELNNAVNAAKNPNVLAVCVGNEGLKDVHNMSDRYTFSQLTGAMNSVRSRTGKPVTTSQQCKSYSEMNLIDACDFEFPTIHPYWEAVHAKKPNLFNPVAGADWTIAQLQSIKNRSGSKIVVAKEVGYPTAGAEGGCNDKTQTDYYVKLTESPLKKAFCYFEAYDQDWKHYNDTEPHWGLFKTNRQPKPAVAAFKAVW